MILEADRVGAAVLAIPIVDTVKQIRKDVDRFNADSRAPRAGSDSPGFSRRGSPRSFRDAPSAMSTTARMSRALWNASDVRVAVVRGSERNIKITRPDDLALARFLSSGGAGGEVKFRIGMGFDLHRLGPGSHLDSRWRRDSPRQKFHCAFRRRCTLPRRRRCLAGRCGSGQHWRTLSRYRSRATREWRA